MKYTRPRIDQFLPLFMIVFYLTVFPRIEAFLLPHIEQGINDLGNFAPIGYILTGISVTVIAPLGLGPLNVLLHKAFGLFPSIVYYFTYTTIGLSINFLLSKYLGSRFLHIFFPETNLKNQNKMIHYVLERFEKVMQKGNIRTFVVFFGGGNELLSYLAGTTSISFWRFFLIIVGSSSINSLLFVNRNLAINENTPLFLFFESLFYISTIISLIVLVSPDKSKILSWFSSLFSVFRESSEHTKIAKKLLLNKSISVKEYTQKINTISSVRNKKLQKLFSYMTLT